MNYLLRKLMGTLRDEAGDEGSASGGAAPPTGGTILDPGGAPTGTPSPTGVIDGATTSAGENPKPLADWATMRAEIANGDEKTLKRLERYSSPKDVAEALLAAQNKIASAGLKEPYPVDGKPEEQAAWREANGVPSKPEDYDRTLPDGLAVGDADKPIIEEFLKSAHAQNMTKDQAKNMLGWFMSERERQISERSQADFQEQQSNTEVLREEWGSEYKLNLNLIGNLLDGAPAGVKDAILSARTGAGTGGLLGNDPNVLRWLASLSREINPTATVVPGSGAAANDALVNEIASIEKMMGDKNSDYWKGPKSAATQARYRELVDVRQKVQGRN